MVQRRNLLDEENLDITLSLDMSKPLHEEIESRRRNSYHSLPFLTNNLGQVIFDKQLGSKPIYKYPNESAPSTQGAHLFYTSNERLKGADSSSQILDIPQDISTKKEFEYMVQKYEQMKVSLQETLKAANQRIEKQDVYIERLENLIKKLSFTDLQKNPHSYVPQNTAEYKHCFPSTPGSSISSECTTDNSEHFSSMQDKHLGSSLDINYQLQPVSLHSKTTISNSNYNYNNSINLQKGSSSGNSFWN